MLLSKWLYHQQGFLHKHQTKDQKKTAWPVANAYNPATSRFYIFHSAFAAFQKMAQWHALVPAIHFLKTISRPPIPGRCGCGHCVFFCQYRPAFLLAIILLANECPLHCLLI